MRAHHRFGLSPPGNDETPELAGGGGFRGQDRQDSSDCAGRPGAPQPVARAAALGIEAIELTDGAWLLRHALGAPIVTVHGLEALNAAVDGFAAAAADVRELVQRCKAGRQ